MRRIYPAFLIILLVLIFYNSFYHIIGNQTENINNALDKTDNYILKDNYEGAFKELKSLKPLWYKFKKTAGILIDKKELENIGYYMSALENSLLNKSKEDYLIFSDAFKYYIENLI